eukprot:3389637-Rhodomonas_salina.1
MQLREALAGDEVIARMYARVFAAHVAAVARGGAGAVLAGLKKRCVCCAPACISVCRCAFGGQCPTQAPM